MAETITNRDCLSLKRRYAGLLAAMSDEYDPRVAMREQSPRHRLLNVQAADVLAEADKVDHFLCVNDASPAVLGRCLKTETPLAPPESDAADKAI